MLLGVGVVVKGPTTLKIRLAVSFILFYCCFFFFVFLGWRFLNELNVPLPYDSVIPLLGICPRERKAYAQTEVCTRVFIAALFC